MKYFLLLISFLFVTSTYAEEITVEMLNKRDDGTRMVYSEDISNINVGDTINWIASAKGHNVHIVAGPAGVELPKKSKMNKDFSHTFDTPGIYYYVCTPHKAMGMIALVIVGGDKSNIDDIAKIEAPGKSKKKLEELINSLWS